MLLFHINFSNRKFYSKKLFKSASDGFSGVSSLFKSLTKRTEIRNANIISPNESTYHYFSKLVKLAKPETKSIAGK